MCTCIHMCMYIFVFFNIDKLNIEYLTVVLYVFVSISS